MEKAEVTELVKNMYFDYARFVNLGGRTLPFLYDTLKTVQRRVLLAAYDLTKNGDFVKSAKVVGHAIGSYHPHGDVSCYGVLVNMVHQGLMEGRGNFGSTSGLSKIDAASYRYTECRLTPKLKDIAFRYINVVPHYENELNTQEPKYLPTMLPLNLIAFSNEAEPVTGIGVGNNMKFALPLFDETEIIKYMIKLIDNKLTGRERINLIYRQIKQKAPKDLMTKGTASVDMSGIYEVSDDEKEIIIKEFPYNPIRLPFTMIEKIDGIPIDKSTDHTEVLIKLDRGRYASEFDLDAILTSNVKFDMMFHDNDYIKLYGVIDLLNIIYTNYKNTVLHDLHQKKEAVQNKIGYYDKVIKMKPYLKNLNTRSVTAISSKLNIKESEVAEIFKKTNLDMIANADDKKKKEIEMLKNINHSINNIDEFCKSHYETLL
jgi:DNA gyrase subunit A